jgi:hypothetical protein
MLNDRTMIKTTVDKWMCEKLEQETTLTPGLSIFGLASEQAK